MRRSARSVFCGRGAARQAPAPTIPPTRITSRSPPSSPRERRRRQRLPGAMRLQRSLSAVVRSSHFSPTKAVPDAQFAGERQRGTSESRLFFLLLGESAAGAAETCVKPRDHLADERAAPGERRFQTGPQRVGRGRHPGDRRRKWRFESHGNNTLLTRSTRKTQSSAGSAAGPRRTWRSRGPSRTRRVPSRRAARSAHARRPN